MLQIPRKWEIQIPRCRTQPNPKNGRKTQSILNKTVQKQNGQTIAQDWDGPTAFWNTSSKLHLKEQKTHISGPNSAQHMHLWNDPSGKKTCTPV
jgi:hypothetical protein